LPEESETGINEITFTMLRHQQRPVQRRFTRIVASKHRLENVIPLRGKIDSPGMAAAYGLSKADAVKAVTLYPAQIMNAADRLGSIEAGKMANIVVTDGDLLESRTRIRYLFIDGRPVVLTSRHTELNDAFKNRK
jgi:adenine deaminase